MAQDGTSFGIFEGVEREKQKRRGKNLSKNLWEFQWTAHLPFCHVTQRKHAESLTDRQKTI
jgi:hypothetical protein